MLEDNSRNLSVINFNTLQDFTDIIFTINSIIVNFFKKIQLKLFLQ